jgi:Mce-associated membrane protein
VIAATGERTAETDIVDETTAASDFDGPPSGEGHDSPARTQYSTTKRRRCVRWAHILTFGVLPGLALASAGGAGYLKWQYDSARASATAQIQSVAAANDSTIALLSYRPDTVQSQLTAARERLTGTFRDSYSSLIHDIIIPGAQQKQISATASVPAVGSVTASATHAVVLLFVDQTVTVGTSAPTSTASSVNVTLDKIGDRWLISDFTPV